MGKADEEMQRIQIITPKKSEWPAVRAALLILTLVIVVIAIDARHNDTPEYQAPPPETVAPWSAPARALFVLCIGTVGLVVIVGLVAGIGALAQAGRMQEAKIKVIETQARTIQPAANGLYPLVEVAGGRIVNPNTAPAGVVEPDGTMPDPETPYRHDAAVRASAVQLVASGRGRLPLGGMMPMMGRQDALPEVRVLQDDEAVDVEQMLLSRPEE